MLQRRIASLTACLFTTLWFIQVALAEPPHFETEVRGIFKQHCFHCHGEEEHPEGGLDLRLVRFMNHGGDSGPAIVPGEPEASVLYQRLRDGEMPPDETKLISPKELKTIHDWIVAGAKTRRPEPESLEGEYFTVEEKSHWSFQPVVRPEVPTVNNVELVVNPIDAFLLSTLEEHGFAFSPEAEPQRLVRRLYMDLHGLPPTPEELDRWTTQADGKISQETWNALVDELLASQHYGERWARHWLDVAGYADSEGYNDADAERPHAWRYRDYVIRALNEDKPYDQFLTEQLAGDELVTSPMNNLSDADAELLAATGFLRMAPDGTGGAVDDVNVARNETVADTIKIVSSSILGMTVGCAQCHDHRYDPISQVDYYRFRAVFDPALDWQSWKAPKSRLVSLYTDEDRKQAAEIEAEAKKIDAERTKKQTEYINATFEKQLAELPEDIHELAREAHKTDAKKRTEEQKALFKKHPNLNVTAGSLYLYDKKAADDLKEMAAKAKKIRDGKPKEEFVRALVEPANHLPVSKLFARGDHQQPKQEVQPGGLTVLTETAALSEIPPNAEDLSTSGRRLALAKRLTDPNHPLTARVIVNRIWLHHFGRGLVTTPNDFGVLGQLPSHPELLDWLAAELVDSGWSLKHLHRLILTSTAWRQQLRNDPELEQADPDNAWFGGARIRRLDAEVVRDAMLTITGQLNKNSFGPSVPVMADRVGRIVVGKENLNAGRPGAVIDMKGEDLRRSVYIQVRRSRPLSVLEAFDQPIMSPNCDKRRPSTSSTQSLMMLNSDQLLEFSRHLAQLLEKQTADTKENQRTESQIQLAWKLIYSRSPNPTEIQLTIQFLKEQAQIFAEQPAYQAVDGKQIERTAEQEALATLCQMLFCTNEFLYVE